MAIIERGGKPTNHTAYKLTYRTNYKNRPERRLTGFAMDLTLRVGGDRTPFLSDETAGEDPMPFGDIEEVAEFMRKEIIANHRDHFGKP